MKSIRVEFIALSDSQGFLIESDKDISEFVKDLLLVFANKIDRDNFKANINMLQQNSADLGIAIGAIIDKYQTATLKIHQLRSYLKKLNEDEPFFFIVNTDLTKEQRSQFYDYLFAQDHNMDLETYSSQINSLFGELKRTYEIYAFDESTKSRIGERIKSQRVCRFCGKANGEVTFKNAAHSISQALGNKKIITNDECDSCNARLGTVIEQDLIHYLDLYRNFFKVKGKRGVPKLKGKNFEMEHKERLEISHFLTEEEMNDPDRDPFKFRVDTSEKIATQNIYRALVKYALSVIDRDLIPHFRETISWINGATSAEELPRVAVLTTYGSFAAHPKLALYVRKTEDQALPYAVAEFRFTFLTFAYIIPMTSKDSTMFVKPVEFDHFWQFFKHYSSLTDWKFQQMNGEDKKPFTINLNFQVNQS